MAVKEKTKVLLIGKAGNRCSFPDCHQELSSPGSTTEGPVLVGEVAHIVAQKPDGARGSTEYPRSKIDEYDNLIYLCPTHHTLIDKQPKAFPIEKLKQFKRDHESWVSERLSPQQARKNLPAPSSTYVQEEVSSTFLPVRAIPPFIYAAPCSHKESKVKEMIIRNREGWMTPFIVRSNTLYTFNDLSPSVNPFSKAVDPKASFKLEAHKWWANDDKLRWYISLLNRSLNKLTGRLGLRWDRDHKRYYFEPLQVVDHEDIDYTELSEEQQAEYDEKRFKRVKRKTLGGTRRSILVAYRPSFKSGTMKSYWEHYAVGLRFHYLGGSSWVLSIRPERRFTKNGYESLTPKGTGSRSTNRKSKMYNIDVQDEIHFWKEYLSRRSRNGGSNRRIAFDFGPQQIVVENKPISFDLSWPGVPEDVRIIKYAQAEEDLFSAALLHGSTLTEEEAEGDFWGSDAEWSA